MCDRPFLHIARLSRTGKIPVPQRVSLIVGWAEEPAHKRLIENGARYEAIALYIWQFPSQRRESFFSRELPQASVRQHQVKLIVHNPVQEAIVKWID